MILTNLIKILTEVMTKGYKYFLSFIIKHEFYMICRCNTVPSLISIVEKVLKVLTKNEFIMDASSSCM